MSCRTLSWGIAALAAVIFAVAPAAAFAAPNYDIKATWSDTNLPPGGDGELDLWVHNVGDTSGEEEMLVKDELPDGVTATGIHFYPLNTSEDMAETVCSGVGTGTVECHVPGFVPGTFLPFFISAPGEAVEPGGAVAEPSGYLGSGPPIGVEVAIDNGVSGAATNTATVSGGGASQPDTDVDQIPFGETPAPFGIVPGSFESDFFNAAFPAGEPNRQAADHPFELRFNFDLNQRLGSFTDEITHITTRRSFPNGSLQTVEATLPRGMIGNPEATLKCDAVKFAEKGSTVNSTACPANTQIGYLNAETASAHSFHSALTRVAIYNLQPPRGTPIDFGFNAGGVVIGHIFAELDPAQDYAAKTLAPNISNLVPVTGSEVTVWGVPGDPAHDRFRYFSKVQAENVALGAPFGGAIRPFFTNPSDCGFANGGTRLRIESYNEPGRLTPVDEYQNAQDVNGCDDPRFRFEPNVTLQPTDIHAGAPTGLDVHLKVPQRDDEVDEAKQAYAENNFVKGISTPPIKKAVVTLPAGMTLSPSAAQGLGSCSSAQVGLGTNDPVGCPDNSQYGKLILHTPILPANAQPEGFIYIAKQGDNPFHNFLSIYLVIEEPERGILVKVPGRIDLDAHTGQITTTFDELPQLPVSDIQMTFKGGVRAGLVEPSTCGPKTIHAEFFSWADPSTPRVVNSSYDITQKPDGTPCVNSLGERQFKPLLEAGTANNAGGSYSPFLFHLTRTDDDQEFSQLGVTLPPGLAAKFAGVTMCPDAGIAQAEARKGAGEGALEQSRPSCPASSLVGTTDVGAGVGVPLTYVPGKVYLAGPYHGAPLSMVVISPAVVGPFDLGVIAVRTALRVNPKTAQGSAESDPFPQIFQGIPVRIRDIRLNLDRPNFTLNPTSCAAKQIDARITGTGGDVASVADDTVAELANHFQAADCASLGFKANLFFNLLGGTKRGGHPRLRAKVTYPKHGAYANIARASVALPRSEFLDQSHIKTVCTRVQFAAKHCPAGSVYGHAAAKTPLFATPLEGPVYLRSSSHTLPDLVAVLRGPASQPVEVDLDGKIDSVNGGIRNTFEVVPDAPVETFTLTMQGGKKGLLVNSTNLCSQTNRAIAKFIGQNGKALTLHPAVKNSCGKARRPERQRGRHGAGAR